MKFARTLLALGSLVPGVASQAWQEVQAGQARIYSASPALALRATVQFATIESTVGGTGNRASLAVLVLGADAFAPFNPQGRLYSVFVQTTDRAYILLGPRAQEPEMIHEYIHYLSAQEGWNDAAWFHEGLAVALSTLRPMNNGGYELAARSRYDGLGCRPALPLAVILGTRDFHQESLGKSQDLYRSSGRLVNFILDRAGLATTLRYFREHREPAVLNQLAELVGLSAEAFQQKFEQYCGAAIPLSQTIPPPEAIVRNVSREQVDDELAGVMVRTPGLAAKGAKYFTERLRRSQDPEFAQANLGIAAVTTGNWSEALQHFAKAGPQSGAWVIYRDYACQRVASCDPAREGLVRVTADESESFLEVTSDRWGCKDGCDWKPKAKMVAAGPK